MPVPYSYDLQQKAIATFNRCDRKSEACRIELQKKTYRSQSLEEMVAAAGCEI